MSNLMLTAQWHDTINQVETSEPITGGAEGNANLATKQLAESLLWLRQQFENKKSEAYKVGDIYMTTIDHADPAAVKAHHGYGTWVRYAEGRAPVGFSDNASDIAEYKTMRNKLGENTHKHKNEDMPSHNINFVTGGIGGTGRPATESTSSSAANLKTDSLGSDVPHNNIQPSIVTGYWLRTA